MAGRQLGRITGKAIAASKPAAVRDRATRFAQLLKTEYEAGLHGEPPAEDEDEVSSAEAVSEALRRVDWAKVRATTSQKSAAVSENVRSMASQVDWDKVTPVAAEVSSAVLMAVATGQLKLGGAMGARLARTVMNDRDLAMRVASSLARTPSQAPPDMRPAVRDAIETTASET
ncbi:MAG: hypothetical protein ACOYMR_03500 [Ilumatobacteraceae bacterium]